MSVFKKFLIILSFKQEFDKNNYDATCTKFGEKTLKITAKKFSEKLIGRKSLYNINRVHIMFFTNFFCCSFLCLFAEVCTYCLNHGHFECTSNNTMKKKVIYIAHVYLNLG